ncbi:MAG: ABC transporter ATP-binding protein [Clostridiales bacterium]|nr:ABC transporter ATP-binding protein [Clostridiales bacterium]
MGETVVRLEHITKEFPGVLANDDVSLEIHKGEILALVGENGAGKSTLMNILYGIYAPTNGEVYICGQKVQTFSPKNAIQMHVGMVHQHFMLVPSFTVAQNIVLSREPHRYGFLYNNSRAEEITRELVHEYGLNVDPSARVEDISVGLQQRVEILKTLYRGADILILDEPTAVLTPQETEELFEVLRRIVREMDKTVILITHKLSEVMAVSDNVGIMRAGKLVGVEKTKDVNERILASMMVGRPVLFDQLEKTGLAGDVQIEVQDLHVRDSRGLMAVNGVNLSVRAGEVLGIAAIEGNGQSELLEALAGMRPCESGSVKICGKPAAGLSAGEIRKIGLSHVPEDRLSTGVDPISDVADNLLAGKQNEPAFNRFGFHQRRSEIDRYAGKLYQEYDIRGAGIHAVVGSMSGGNMQKVVVAREFSHGTPVLLISNPSRGIDIGAMEFIHTAIIQKRNEGCAILLSSADLDEVFRLSDRIITMYEGRITGEFPAEKASREEIGYYMTGHRKEEVEIHEAAD